MGKASELAKKIVAEIQNEFTAQHLTKNIINTMQVIEMDNEVIIRIPAPSYDFKEYFLNKAIVPPTKGGIKHSYAQDLNDRGSEMIIYWQRADGSIGQKKVYPRNHVGFVDNAVWNGIAQFLHNENYSHAFIE